MDVAQCCQDPRLHMDSMCHLWDRFTMAQQEKDMAIQAEIARYVLVTGVFVWWDLAYGTHCPLLSRVAELCRHSENALKTHILENLFQILHLMLFLY